MLLRVDVLPHLTILHQSVNSTHNVAQQVLRNDLHNSIRCYSLVPKSTKSGGLKRPLRFSNNMLFRTAVVSHNRLPYLMLCHNFII